MFSRINITEAGGTELLPGEMVTVSQFTEANNAAKEKNVNLAKGQALLLGITKASLGTQSWISAASFQETTKVLSSAAIQGKSDDMLGLKENVITGHHIPAGTGLRDYENIIVGSKEEYELLQTTREVMSFDEEE
jgi:DNA-directed RNA polymerase subunit beta'